MINHFGKKIRELREAQNLLLRHVAPFLEMDTPLLSKIERGQRTVKKEIIPQLASILHADEDELSTLWLADQLMNTIGNEDHAEKALKLVSNNIKTKNESYPA